MNQKNKKITISFIIIALLLIGVIYAILQANLQINGIAKIGSNSWDIHFDNVQVNENSVSIGTGDSAATIDPNDNCKVDFSVTLSLPGDFYEFTVDVVNAGTIDGMIGELHKTLSINNEVLDEIPYYLNYVVTYSDGSQILDNHLLKSGETLSYKVRLEYKTDIEELPDASTLTSSFDVQYLQADDTAIRKPPYNPCTYDGDLVQDAQYINGQYTYTYSTATDGWSAMLTDKNSTDPVSTPLCTTINGKYIVSMRNMFSNTKATNIDTSSFDTSHVTTMYGMFQSAKAISNLDLSTFDVSNVTDMSYMFHTTGYNASSFYLNLDNWDPSNVTLMNNMFANAGNSASSWEIAGDISKWNLSKVTNLSGLFQYIGTNGASIDLDLSDWNVSNVTNLSDMFNWFGRYASSVHLNLKNWDVSSVTNMYNMFYYLGSSASSIDIGDLSNWNVSNVTTFQNMFRYIGNNCNEAMVRGLSAWNISSTANIDGMFAYTCYNSGYFDFGTLNLSSNNLSYVFNYSNVKGTVNIKANPTSYYDTFYQASTHTGSEIVVNYTSAVTSIDNIIATKSSSSNVVKGSLLTS